MIKLLKNQEPAILKLNSALWTSNLLQKLANGEKLTDVDRGHYRHKEIKEALIAETHAKCAYCESKFRHVTFGDVEHVAPKSTNPALWFSWTNLTIVCDLCNTFKSDYKVDNTNFIDPYAVDPEEHFWHLGAIIFAAPGSEAATRTEKLLQLNRSDLIERRNERLKSLMRQLEVVSRVTDPDLKKVLLADFKEETLDNKEFAALARTVAQMANVKMGA